MVAARERTLRIEEQLEMLGDELARERTSTAQEKRKSAQLSAVSAVNYDITVTCSHLLTSEGTSLQGLGGGACVAH